MLNQTVLSNTIDTTDQIAQYDASVKRLLSQKIVLAWVLKECVTEFKSLTIPQLIGCIEGDPQVAIVAVDADELDYVEETIDTQIEGLNTEDSSINEGTVYYDIRFSAVAPGSEEPVQLIINVEAQKSDKTPYPLIKRAIYYGSRMISAQKNKIFQKKHYEKIRKVYSIWILMNVDEANANTITRYRISEEQVVGNVPERESNYDLMTVLMLRLGAEDKAKNEPILRLLDVLLSEEIKPEDKKTILEKDFDIPMSIEMNEEANIMCNLGEGIQERERERTTIETRINDVLNLMESLKFSAEEAVDALRVPDDDRQSLLNLVDQRLAVE